MDEKRCSEDVRSEGGWHYHKCLRDATVECDGKWYCWQHDPEYIAKKRRKEKEGWEKDWREKKEKAYRRRKMAAFFEGVATEDIPKLFAWADLQSALRDSTDIVPELIRRIFSKEAP